MAMRPYGRSRSANRWGQGGYPSQVGRKSEGIPDDGTPGEMHLRGTSRHTRGPVHDRRLWALSPHSHKGSCGC